MSLVLVFVGGGAGAIARYLLGGWIQARVGPVFPLGIFIVNVSGSFLIGLILGLIEAGLLGAQSRLLLAVGFCGGYTTFSSFSYDNLQLFQGGPVWGVLLNPVGQVALGLAVVYLGVEIGRVAGGG